jgi:2-polyprenyl-3-methyl-5-hydroxy-6-metoxy-1,4-benzoquinol methylase
MDNSAYLERAADYDAENQNKSRTLLKKAALVAAAIEQHARGTSMSILEVGCGTGLFTELLAERFPHARITATDAFLPMLDIARERLSGFRNISLAQYDAEKAGSFSQRFDVVCGVDLIHHLTDPVAGLRHWRELTAPGGALVFFESNPRNPALYLRTMNRPEEVRFKYNTRPNLTTWATTAGWTMVSIEYAPIYLPNGPRRFWSALGHIESAMHPALWPISGGMIIRAERDRR